MKFLLTTDWQAKFNNLDACRRAHEQELNIIQKENCKGHIDLGDLKDDFNPVDISVVEFQQHRISALNNACRHTIRIMGNHDMLGQYDSGKNWFSLFNLLGGHNVSKPQIIRAGNCIFSCLPFRRSSNLLLKQADELKKKMETYDSTNANESDRQSSEGKQTRRILVFHSDVRGTRYSKVNRLRSESTVALEGLHTTAYDRCFGGHIHLRQNLSRNTMYVGNPFATDNGEIDQQKGFILYDDEEDEIRFVKSVVPGIFSWSYVQKYKPKLIEGTKIKATVDCNVKDDYHKEIDKVASAIEKKYPDCISLVIPKFSAEEARESVEVDPTASDIEKVKMYVQASVPADLRKQRHALYNYIAHVLANSTSTGIRQSGKVIFDNIVAENVLSFEKLSFSFRNKGIVLVQGENKDAPWNSNGSGKTNFLSIIPICLFGRTFKKQKSDNWASDRNKDTARATLFIRDEKSRVLTIERQRRPVKLKLKINDLDESKGRRHVGKKETQGLIEETIGYTFDTLKNSVYLDQTMEHAFLSGSDSDRAKLIYQFQNMDRFKLAKDLVSKELYKVREHRVTLEGALDSALSLLKQTNKDKRRLEKRKRIQRSELKSKYQERNKELTALTTALDQLNRVQENLEKKSAKRIAEIESSIATVDKQIYALERQVEEKQKELEDIEEIGKATICPVCKKPISAGDKDVLYKRYKKAIGAKNTEIKKLENRKEHSQKELLALEAPAKRLCKEIDEVHRLKTIAEEAAKNAKENLDREDTQDTTILSKRIVRLEKQIHTAKVAIRHTSADIDFLAYAQDSLGREGLPAFLNKLLCPLLNKAAAKYSEVFVDKEIQVLFDVENGDITPTVINMHGGKSIDSQSTGEKAWAAIITSFALREIATPTNLLIMDEPGHGLDTVSAKMFGERLTRLKTRFETVLIVSHNPAIISALESDSSVTVVKRNKISSLK